MTRPCCFNSDPVMKRRYSSKIALGVLFAVILTHFIACNRATETTSPTIETFAPAPAATPVSPDDLVSVLPRDAIEAIDDPQFDSAEDARAYMRPDEQVIGLALNDDVRAYPINVLSRHEVVNDVVGGVPVAVTWCPLCYSALVFSRQVDGRELTFGVSGKLYENNLVMYDRQTESLWSQLLGQAVAGPLRGKQLRMLTASQQTWDAWQAEHPNTRVLSKPKTLQAFLGSAEIKDPMYNYAVDRYRSYYASEDRGLVNRNIPEGTELTAKRRVVGLRLDNAAKAYFFDALAEAQAVNDHVAGQPVLITFDPRSENGAGFDRRLDDQVLTFEVVEDGDGSVLRDVQTGSRWDRLTGRGVGGRLAGRQLRRLPTTYAFWFAWKAHFPETQVYE